MPRVRSVRVSSPSGTIVVAYDPRLPIWQSRDNHRCRHDLAPKGLRPSGSFGVGGYEKSSDRNHQ